MRKVKNSSGTMIDYATAVELMDQGIIEEIGAKFDTLSMTNQQFFAAYEREHLATYGEPWELSKANPVY